MRLSDLELSGGCTDPIPEPVRRGPLDLLLVDRDGTLNVHRPGYVERPDDLHLLPGVAKKLRAVNDAGVPVVVVTNQQGVGKGVMSLDQLVQVHRRLVDLLAREGARLDGFAVCPHLAGTCACRKPDDGLFRAVFGRARWARPTRCLMVGDRETDLRPAAGLGCAVVQDAAARWDFIRSW